jgi:hypothetical protein
MNQPPKDYSYVATDIKRILLLTLLAIVASIMLWYMVDKGIIKIF